jgi:hypothetical protein
MEYGKFRIKIDIKKGNKVGADNSDNDRGDYTQKNSIIASGATTIGSAERAPDDIYH